MANGDILKEAERRGMLSPQMRAVLKEAERRAARPGVPGRTTARLIDDTVRSVAEGMTLGFADEISAAANAALSSELTFEQALEQERARTAEIPMGERVAANIVGGMAVPGAIGLRAPTSVGQAVRQGAGLGTVGGVGFAEGGLAERATGGAVGAAIGGPLAGVTQGGIQGATALANRVRQGLTRPQAGALNRAALELSASGTTPQQIVAQQQRLGPQAVLADVPELQPLAQQTASRTIAGNRIARQALEGRQAQAGQRVDEALDIALGGQNVRQVRQGILNARRNEAADLYGEALSVGPLQRTEALEGLIGTLDDAGRVQRGSGSSLVRNTMNDIRAGNPRFRNAPDTDPDLLHATRVALSERAKGQGAQKRNINDVVQQLTDAMDDAGAEGYREAVNRYRSDSLTLEAFDRGRKALNELPEDIEAFLQAAPAGEQAAFVAGLGREAQKLLTTGETGNAANAVRGLLRGERAQILRESLGPQAFNALRTRLLRELEFSRTAGRVLGGSPTQPRQAAAAEQFARMGRAQRAFQQLRQGGVPQAAAELLVAAERPGPRLAEERALAQLLFATGRQGLDQSRFQAQNPLLALAGSQRLVQRTAPLRSAAPGAAGAAGGQTAQPLLELVGF